ncbi:gamma carbonic anhydrase family protein [Anaeromyxobacter diazotrophicus]|uniref:Gamma carbonic anhydrase family protein n=1 Tax=Anaeromyxobacter diazotrophicus TaxID=2590199 RepID=A0A7I9VST0_9BACT|nr:gamma carbonic anhydrase family protein [Anaeromyxobacter diazotrophicus]GEJ59278.1 gamma carbonic anhydrase family protein [Anaeromyxobacter diazotrophicus]
MATIRPFGGKTPQLHDTVFAVESAVVVGDVVVGEHASLWFGAIVRGDVNHVRIGARTNVQDHAVIHVTSHTHPTVVGEDVTIGHRVTLHGCTIRDRCLIGIAATVLDGAVVGEETLVGAGALVPPGMVVPPRTLALGSPAKVKRELTADEIAFFRTSAQNYVRYAQQYLREGWSGR